MLKCSILSVFLGPRAMLHDGLVSGFVQSPLSTPVAQGASLRLVSPLLSTQQTNEVDEIRQEDDKGRRNTPLLPFCHSSTVYIEMTDMRRDDLLWPPTSCLDNLSVRLRDPQSSLEGSSVVARGAAVLCSTVITRAIIEHERYGIVYHANYLTYVRRAMERCFGGPAPRVHGIRDMRYRAAATLGEQVAVDGELLSHDSERGISHWRFQIAATIDRSRVFVTADAFLSWPREAWAEDRRGLPPRWQSDDDVTMLGVRTLAEGSVDAALLEPLPNAFGHAPKTLEVVVWNDDMEGGELSVRAVLNYFERIRTLSLGRDEDGELGLMRLHREGVSIVVTKIPDLRVKSQGVSAGEKLDVRLAAKLTRGNKMMTMYETLWRENGTLVAHAEIALLCIDNENRRFRVVPQWVQDVLEATSATEAE